MKDFHARVPVNGTAARVTSKGTGYTPKNIERIMEACSDTPLPTRPIPKEATLTPSWVDLTGKKFGSLTVIGLHVDKEGGSGGKCRWVCKCSCGRWTTRKTRVVKVGDPTDCCAHCYHTVRLRRTATFIATGVWPEDGK